jgi:hypothetical protein
MSQEAKERLLPPRLNSAARRLERRAWLRALLVKEARAATELAEEQLEHDVRTQRSVLGLTRGVDGVRPSDLGAAKARRARVDEKARCLEGQRRRPAGLAAPRTGSRAALRGPSGRSSAVEPREGCSA